MPRPLARYVTLTYAKYFVALLVPFVIVALPLATDLRIAYFTILPLAAVCVAAFACTLRVLSSKGELETLQTYGVPERSVGKPLAFAMCAPLVAFSAAAILLSADRERALLFGAIGLIVAVFVPLAVVRRCWSRR